MGWPGFWGSSPSYSRINLGWCNDMSAVGNMVHEIAHAIGMNHEHKRADAAQEYNGHGPHLIMHWQNIDAGWLSQYTPDYKSYIGSTNQGLGDVGKSPEHVIRQLPQLCINFGTQIAPALDQCCRSA